MSDFDFIADQALVSNLNQTNDLVIELVLRINSPEYNHRKSLVSSLCKTVVIYVATIVEAMLLWSLRQHYPIGEIESKDEWEYKDVKLIYSLEHEASEIIWSRRRHVKRKLDKLDFLHIIKQCKICKIITDEDLLSDIDSLRKLRNNLHIGGMRVREKIYNADDLEYCFSVMERTIRSLSNAH